MGHPMQALRDLEVRERNKLIHENERMKAALILIKERSSEGHICIIADVGLRGEQP